MAVDYIKHEKKMSAIKASFCPIFSKKQLHYKVNK